MLSISFNLSNALKNSFKEAEELWIAVGLLNMAGLEFIIKAIPKNCKLNFIVGIDLPTSPKALIKLLYLKKKRTITISVLTQKFFHPKVYIIKSTGNLTAFVGSANCTMGGLNNNIEASIGVKEQDVCSSLLQWFNKDLLPISLPLTPDFIKDYQPKYDNRVRRRQKDEKEIEEVKEKEQIKLNTAISKRTKLISSLKQVRKSSRYEQMRTNRQTVIEKLKISLDYPNFKDINLTAFFSEKELGTLPRIKVKNQIINNQLNFTRLMKYICNEDIPVSDRIETALYGNLSIHEIGIAFISKILTIHNPNEYYVYNRIFTEKMKTFGMEIPKGISFGEKYEMTRDVLKLILKESQFDDFATFDDYLQSI